VKNTGGKMKTGPYAKIAIMVLGLPVSVIFFGCGPENRWFTRHIQVSYTLGEEQSVTVGSPMITEEKCVDTHMGKPGDLPERKYRECHFRQELIYNGISKGVIRVTYREYSNDMARPAFFQDLVYDLDESDLIQFREFRIKVIDAHNLGIVFVVQSERARDPEYNYEKIIR
jgi:hypothetical protein